MDVGIILSSKMNFLVLLYLLFGVCKSSRNENQPELKFTIVTVIQEPFVFEIVGLKNSSKKIGLVKDILDLLSERMNFTYDLHWCGDGNYGAPDANGVWNGMVGEVLYGRADMAAADLTVTAARSEVVKFSTAYMKTDLGFIYKKPDKYFHFGVFFTPFSAPVWILVVGCSLSSSFFFYMFEKHRDEQEPLEKVGSFHLKLARLFAKGPENYPKSVFCRTTALSWWFFSLMMLSLYTAALTSMLTVNRADFPLRTIEELLRYQHIAYAVENIQILKNLFANSEYAPFQVMWNEMSKQKEEPFLSHRIGVNKVRNNENFAFIRESPYLEYEVTLAPCNLNYVISAGSPKPGDGFAFAFPPNSTLVTNFSIEILRMFSNGEMATIHAKWFKTRSQCSGEKTLNTSMEALGFQEICGIFYIFIAGLGLSCIIFLIQLTKSKFGYCRSAKNSPSEDFSNIPHGDENSSTEKPICGKHANDSYSDSKTDVPENEVSHAK